MNLLSNIKKPIAYTFVALALMISSVVLPSGSSAYPYYSTYSTYYSDASMTNEVGTLYVECSGRTHKTGVITQYRTEEIVDVCYNGLPQ